MALYNYEFSIDRGVAAPFGFRSDEIRWIITVGNKERSLAWEVEK